MSLKDLEQEMRKAEAFIKQTKENRSVNLREINSKRQEYQKYFVDFLNTYSKSNPKYSIPQNLLTKFKEQIKTLIDLAQNGEKNQISQVIQKSQGQNFIQDSLAFVDESEQQQILQQFVCLSQVEIENRLISKQQDQLNELEGVVNEINRLVKQINELVNQQGEQVDVIQGNLNQVRDQFYDIGSSSSQQQSQPENPQTNQRNNKPNTDTNVDDEDSEPGCYLIVWFKSCFCAKN